VTPSIAALSDTNLSDATVHIELQNSVFCLLQDSQIKLKRKLRWSTEITWHSVSFENLFEVTSIKRSAMTISAMLGFCNSNGQVLWMKSGGGRHWQHTTVILSGPYLC